MNEIIAVDIGNSRITCGRFVGGNLSEIWHHETSNALKAAQGIYDAAGGNTAVLCSVVPPAGRIIRDYLNSRGLQVQEIQALRQGIITGTYDTLGADRVANAAAAWKLYGQDNATVVIDLGTATTLTAVSETGHFSGGFITLGLGATLKALNQGTAQLPALAFEDRDYHSSNLAGTTSDAITAGSLFAHIGSIEYWLKLARANLGQKLTTIATGGWSKILCQYSKVFDHLDSELTLKGIYLIAREVVPADQG